MTSPWLTLGAACALTSLALQTAGATETVPLRARSATADASGNPGWYTFHFDNGRTGWNPHETRLTVTNVGSKLFGLVRTLAADGVVYAQPLYVPHRRIGGSIRDVVVIASENDGVFAYDANTGQSLWQRSVLESGERAVPSSSVGCSQIAPKIGISSTPVIDAKTGTLYVSSKVTSGSPATYHNYLNALNLASGADALPRMEIAGSVMLSDGSTSTFVPQWQQQRPGLLLSRGTIYLGFGSSCDENASFVHGWVFSYDAATLQRTGIFSTIGDPASYEMDAIWQGTFGLAADGNGDLYFATGNGAFDLDTGGTNYGDTVLRLAPDLAVKDWFAPHNEANVSARDLDVGSAGVVLVPDGTTPHHSLAVQGGKNGAYFLLDRTHLGGYHKNGPDDVLQEIKIPQNAEFGGSAYAGGFVYLTWSGAPISAYAVSLSGSKPQLVPSSKTPDTYNGEGGPIPAISSNGTQSGTAVLWATTDPGPGGTIQLNAYDASNLSKQLFTGAVGTWNANAGAFLSPTVAGSHVFVPGAGNGVAEFGLLTP